jgi:hypothetical protein
MLRELLIQGCLVESKQCQNTKAATSRASFFSGQLNLQREPSPCLFLTPGGGTRSVSSYINATEKKSEVSLDI